MEVLTPVLNTPEHLNTYFLWTTLRWTGRPFSAEPDMLYQSAIPRMLVKRFGHVAFSCAYPKPDNSCASIEFFLCYLHVKIFI